VAALEGGAAELDDGLELFGRVLLVLAMVLASIIYVRLEDPETLASNVRLGLLALVVIFNLGLVRAVYSVGGAELFVRDPTWASALPYLAPTALAPLIVAILIDAGSAIFMALLISIFTGVIYGNRLDLLVLTFLASMVAIFGCRDARRRGRVVAAAGMGGLTVAAFAALIGVAQQTPYETLVWQMAAGPPDRPPDRRRGRRPPAGPRGALQADDRHHAPRAHRLQPPAPAPDAARGPGHLPPLARRRPALENACNAIGANPLLARACALFHDIGKTANPAFFTENQRDAAIPTTRRTPPSRRRSSSQHVRTASSWRRATTCPAR
jgi:cyclic-di-AMP phosphodiesterase PgpH